jgi:prophage antirepressor-like protein
MEYYMRLTNFYSQFRAIGVNYNQVVKHLKTVFTEKMLLAMLYKLEKATRELVAINQQIVDLTREFEEKWLKKGAKFNNNQYLCIISRKKLYELVPTYRSQKPNCFPHRKNSGSVQVVCRLFPEP